MVSTPSPKRIDRARGKFHGWWPIQAATASICVGLGAAPRSDLTMPVIQARRRALIEAQRAKPSVV
jgi:hypothetical protein